MYRNDQKVRFAKGMTKTFTDEMPRRVEPAVRQGIIGLTNRTYYFEYRNGSRLIPPALQEDIRNLFRTNGWTDEVEFDGYEYEKSRARMTDIPALLYLKDRVSELSPSSPRHPDDG